MTEHQQKSPITPPPELVQQWCDEWYRLKVRINTGIPEYVATQAARWGADQELEECCEWLGERDYVGSGICGAYLRAARRPKPPSLAEEALAALNEIEDRYAGPSTQEILVRRALERLQELESNG